MTKPMVSIGQAGKCDRIQQPIGYVYRKKKAWLLSALLAVSLSAYGDNDSSVSETVNDLRVENESSKLAGAKLGVGHGSLDTLQRYRNQTVYWGSCDSTILGRDRGAEFNELGPRLQCANFQAPLDYANVSRGDVSISVMRLAAENPVKRRGALVFNPGGPGADGLWMTLSLLSAFKLSNPATEIGAMNVRLLAEYDMVGFSPRGTGASTRVHCSSNELLQIEDLSAAGVTSSSLDKSTYNGKKIAEACLKNPLIPYINSNDTARDMDLLRAILGDEQLNYLGYSYGTWLGARYASLFPNRVGRMVLVGLADITKRLETTFTRMPLARQRLLDEFMVPYALRHSDAFNLGSSKEAIAATLGSLDAKVQYVLGDQLAGAGYSRRNADAYVLNIKAAQQLQGFLTTAADPWDRSAATRALLTTPIVPKNFAQDGAARALVRDLYLAYAAAWEPNPRSRIPILLPATDAVYWAIRCNDSPATTDVSEWSQMVRDTSRDYPLFASVVRPPICTYWGGPRVSTPSLAPMKKLDVLLVQSDFDAATAVENAHATFAALPNAHLVLVPEEFEHGVYPYMDFCVDQTVASYLLGKKPEGRETRCQPHPLKQDKIQALPRFGATAAASSQEGDETDALAQPLPPDHPLQTYKDPARARELIEEFKDSLMSPLDAKRVRGFSREQTGESILAL